MRPYLLWLFIVALVLGLLFFSDLTKVRGEEKRALVVSERVALFLVILSNYFLSIASFPAPKRIM